MQFLSLFTPAVPTPTPTAEHMQQMQALTERKFESGRLVTTGALGHREIVGVRVTKKGDKITVLENPPGDSVVMAAGGFAILDAPSKEACIAEIEEFLEAAGEGTCECIGLAFPLMQPRRSLMAGIVPNFMVDGANEAAKFYEKAFGARELGRYAHTDGKRLMHCHMEINGGSMMFNDPMPEHGYPLQASSSYTMNLIVADGDFWWNRAVEAGCTVAMPFERAFWGDRYGRVIDPFGIAWAIDEPAAPASAAA